MRNHFDFVSSSRGYLREDETDEKNEIPCSGPEQDTPNRSILGQAFPSRHPDNAPGQDPGLSRKRDRREENRQSLFSLSSSRERSELSNIRFLGFSKRLALL